MTAFANSQPATVIISTNAVQVSDGQCRSQPVRCHWRHGATLDGLSASTDPPEIVPLMYTWSLITRPPNSNAALSATNIVNPTFVTDQPGTYRRAADGQQTDSFSSTTPATVTITTADVQPVANAGPNQAVIAGNTVTLDGSQSNDPDNQPLTYSWAFLSIPGGSNAVLIGSTTVNPTFVADVAGIYVVQLIVSDPFLSSNPSTVTISAGNFAITLSPNPLNLTNSPGTLTVTLNPPAGTSPVSVSLSGFNPSVISVPNPVTVPANSASVNVTVTPLASGSTQVIANAAGYQPWKPLRWRLRRRPSQLRSTITEQPSG